MESNEVKIALRQAKVDAGQSFGHGFLNDVTGTYSRTAHLVP